MTDTHTHKDGGRKGYSPDDYREAVEETGSIRGAANELGVNYRTAYDACKRHSIYVPTLDGPPGQN